MLERDWVLASDRTVLQRSGAVKRLAVGNRPDCMKNEAVVLANYLTADYLTKIYSLMMRKQTSSKFYRRFIALNAMIIRFNPFSSDIGLIIFVKILVSLKLHK